MELIPNRDYDGCVKRLNAALRRTGIGRINPLEAMVRSLWVANMFYGGMEPDGEVTYGEATMTAQLHPSTFEYLKPTAEQMEVMVVARRMVKDYADYLDGALYDGADKDYILRRLREVARWVTIAITRQDNGSPRT